MIFAPAFSSALSLLAVASTPAGVDQPLPALPYEPGLNVESMDKKVDPCVDFYTYSCGGWQKRNPIPADQSSWSVYGKLEIENLQYLWGLLDDAAKKGAARSAVEQKVGDYFASCMDTATLEKKGTAAVDGDVHAIEAIKSTRELPALLGKLQRETNEDFVFGFSSDQDWENSERIIGEFSAGGLGLPDRDYYFRADAKSAELRAKYVAHIEKMLALSGVAKADAHNAAANVMKLETALAQASLTNVEKRDPHNLAHHATLKELQAMAPSFAMTTFLASAGVPSLDFFNVTEPKFMSALEAQMKAADLATWKSYLRFHVLKAREVQLPKAFDDEHFDFYSKTLRGVQEQPPRWKRCVRYVDRDLGEALGQVFVQKSFTQATKESTVKMTKLVEDAMEQDIKTLSWMSEKTKQQALVKLHAVANKVGYPDHWRDYTKLDVKPGDFAGNVERASTFEFDRQLAKIGKPLDRSEWGMTAPTVNAYYNPQMNDINFPAGVLQAPLFDPKLDDAPSYGNTGSTIGHELTHAFDDEGSQFDDAGNLRNWWTEPDAKAFAERTQCVVDQYGAYPVIDDIKINSKLTLGEDVADLGGTILALAAWHKAEEKAKLAAKDGLTPEQRFFVGFAQWACSNERPEDVRLHALTNPHSPPKYRINGVVANMPEFAAAFQCKKDAPLVRAKPCRVW